MAVSEHVSVLRKGVEAWNRWREANPEIKPDLSGTDFTDGTWKDTPIWDSERQELVFTERKPSGEFYKYRELFSLRSAGINFSETNLNDCNLRNAILWHAQGRHMTARRSDFCGASFASASLKGAYLILCNLRDADFWDADITGGSLHGSDITGTNFKIARVMDLWTTEVKYSRGKMNGKYRGIVGVAATRESARWTRDAADQDLIDSRREHWISPWYNPKRVFLLWPWAALDYGRSLFRVILLAALIIACFGLTYPYLNETGHITVLPEAGVDNGFRPFYIAAIAFSTLGFTDVVVAQSWIGQLALMSNVLLGYVTLGLLLAILANNVARRA